jgi:hypothetical protein
MIITETKLRETVRQILLEFEPTPISDIDDDSTFRTRTPASSDVLSTDERLYDLQVGLLGLKDITKDKSQPLALRLFAKFYSGDTSDFTNKDMTEDELRVLKKLVYTGMKDKWDEKKIPIRYGRNEDAYNMAFPDIGSASEDWMPEMHDYNNDTTIARNLKYGLGEFWVQPQDSIVIIEDGYDFKGRFVDPEDYRSALTDALPKSSVFIYSLLKGAYLTMMGNSPNPEPSNAKLGTLEQLAIDYELIADKAAGFNIIIQLDNILYKAEQYTQEEYNKSGNKAIGLIQPTQTEGIPPLDYPFTLEDSRDAYRGLMSHVTQRAREAGGPITGGSVTYYTFKIAGFLFLAAVMDRA